MKTWWRALAVLAAALCFVAAAGRGARAVDGEVYRCDGCPFGARPAPGQPGPGSYFDLTAAPGEERALTLQVVNEGDRPQTLFLAPAWALPLWDTGYAYEEAGSPREDRRRELARWVRGLPDRVHLAAGEARNIPFTVTVPPETRAGQYLAGVAVWPVPPEPPEAGRAGRGEAAAQVVVARRISVGVAVTVRPEALDPRFVIDDVRQHEESPGLRALIHVRNPGNAFARPRGTLTLQFPDGTRREYGAAGDTVLPEAEGAIPVVLPDDIPDGTYPARAEIAYHPERPPAIWEGMLTLRRRAVEERREVREDGTVVVYRDAGIPPWAAAAAAAGGLAAGGALLLVFAAWRRRRRTAPSAGEGGGGTA